MQDVSTLQSQNSNMVSQIGSIETAVGSVEDTLGWLVGKQNRQTVLIDTLTQDVAGAEGEISTL